MLLHSCCAPCSSAALEAVEGFFSVSVFYYNPNITSRAEYELRLDEQKKFLSAAHEGVGLIEGEYEPSRFYEIAEGLEAEPERGLRCQACYRLRLMRTAEEAKRLGFGYFATTLTLSPLKNAEAINRIGCEAASAAGVKYLPTDFKKNDGYKRSIELFKEYGLYRQNYCGCEFSKRPR